MESKMAGKSNNGKFIVLEGVDNCGKTTQAGRLAASLKRQGYEVLPVREPGGTKVSEKIRRILLSRTLNIDARTEVFLYLAARAQVTAEKIAPALATGKIVIADRYHLSTYAYQIGGRRMPAEVVKAADHFARHAIRPDITFILDITPAESRKRMTLAGKKPDRIEKEKSAFFARIRQYYRLAARTEKDTVLLSGHANPNALAAEIEMRTLELIKRR
jgi:dTMP kinase